VNDHILQRGRLVFRVSYYINISRLPYNMDFCGNERSNAETQAALEGGDPRVCPAKPPPHSTVNQPSACVICVPDYLCSCLNVSKCSYLLYCGRADNRRHRYIHLRTHTPSHTQHTHTSDTVTVSLPVTHSHTP